MLLVMSLPENIENMEEFYRKNLADLEIPPPVGLWEGIKPHVPKGKPGLGIKGWGIASVSVLTISAVVVWKTGVFSNKESTKDVTVPVSVPIQEKKINETVEKRSELKFDVPSEKESVNKVPLQIKAPSAQKEKEQPVENVAQEETLVEDPHINALPTDPAPIEEKKTAPVEEKNISFYEKMKSKSRDSLRPIFVPKK
jgi:hypothetical protein